MASVIGKAIYWTENLFEMKIEVTQKISDFFHQNYVFV